MSAAQVNINSILAHQRLPRSNTHRAIYIVHRHLAVTGPEVDYILERDYGIKSRQASARLIAAWRNYGAIRKSSVSRASRWGISDEISAVWVPVKNTGTLWTETKRECRLEDLKRHLEEQEQIVENIEDDRANIALLDEELAKARAQQPAPAPTIRPRGGRSPYERALRAV